MYRFNSVSWLKKARPGQNPIELLIASGFAEKWATHEEWLGNNTSRSYIRGNIVYDSWTRVFKQNKPSERYLELMKKKIEIENEMSRIVYDEVGKEISDLIIDKIAIWDGR